MVGSKPSIVNSKKKVIRDFSDLEAWKVNHSVVLEIYKITGKFPKQEKYGIVDQLRRAASSITANIAEAWGRYHYADKIRIYYQARGSSAEVTNFIILAHDLGYLSKKEFSSLKEKIYKGFQLLSGLIRSTKTYK